MSKNKKNTQEKNNNSTIKTVALIAGVAVGSAVGTGASVFIANQINNKDVNTSSGADSSVVDSVDSVADNSSTGDDNVALVRPLAFDNDSDRQNAIADLDDGGKIGESLVERITKKVNGGLIGIADRKYYYRCFKKEFGV